MNLLLLILGGLSAIFRNALFDWLAELVLRGVSRKLEKWFPPGHRPSYGGKVEYMEAAIETYIELLRHEQRQGASNLLILLKSIGCFFQLGRIGLQLWVNDLLYPFTVFQRCAVLVAGFDGSLDVSFRRMRHLIDDLGGAYLVLDRRGRVQHWDQSAQELFLFKPKQVMQRVATTSFIPAQETGGRSLLLFLPELCQTPDRYGLNLNENITANAKRMWIFWVNLPVYKRGRLVQIHCLGFNVAAPKLLRALIWLWNRGNR